MTAFNKLSWITIFFIWPYLCLADQSLEACADRLSGNLLSIEMESFLATKTISLAPDHPVTLEWKSGKTREGDPVQYRERPSDDSAHEYETQGGINALLTRLIHRYYFSHTLPHKLLPGQVKFHNLSPGHLGLIELLPLDKVLSTDHPKLLPALALHEDSHYVRREDLVINHSRHEYQVNHKLDIPNLMLKTSVEYKYLGHGDSEKVRQVFIGRRLELTRNFRTSDPSVQAYEKLRYDSNNKIVARTAVIKSAARTIRLRLTPELSDAMENLITRKLNQEFGGNIQIVGVDHLILKIRHNIRIAQNSPDNIPIGRLSLDVNIELQNSNLDNLPPNRISSDFPGELQTDFLTYKTDNKVMGGWSEIKFEYDPSYENQISNLIDDIRKNIIKN